jgi:hypothetical protein
MLHNNNSSFIIFFTILGVFVSFSIVALRNLQVPQHYYIASGDVLTIQTKSIKGLNSFARCFFLRSAEPPGSAALLYRLRRFSDDTNLNELKV